MKTSLLIILLISVISCSKSKPTLASPTPPLDSSSISFKFNDTLVTIKGGFNSFIVNKPGVYATKVFVGYPSADWVYNIHAKSDFYNDLLLSIYTDSLKVQTYNYYLTQKYSFVNPAQGLFLGIQYKNLDYQIFFPNDSINLDITKFSNGYISGTFSANITPVNKANPVPGSTKITSGTFQNLQVIY